MAQAPYEPSDKDRAVVRAMAAYGIPHDEIGAVVGCSDVTLRKYYRAELDTAAPQFKARIVERLSAIALDDGKKWSERAIVTALVFLGKTRAGLRETVRHEGGERPVQVSIVTGIDRAARDETLELDDAAD